MNRRFILLSGLVMAAALFVGGCSASNSASGQPAAQSTPAAQAGVTSGQGAANSSGNASAANNGRRQGPAPVVGTVASVNGDLLTVTTRQGDAKVKVTGAQIQKTVAGTASDLTAGETVVVMGQQGSDGSFAATNIQIRPSNAAGQGGFQGQGQGQGLRQGPRPLFGSVVSVQGDNLTVKTQQGNSTVVKINGAAIEKTVDGTVSDLKSGETVMATGQQGSDGTLSASFIQIRPAGALYGGPGRAAGSQPSPAATPSGS